SSRESSNLLRTVDLPRSTKRKNRRKRVEYVSRFLKTQNRLRRPADGVDECPTFGLNQPHELQPPSWFRLSSLPGSRHPAAAGVRLIEQRRRQRRRQGREQLHVDQHVEHRGAADHADERSDV